MISCDISVAKSETLQSFAFLALFELDYVAIHSLQFLHYLSSCFEDLLCYCYLPEETFAKLKGLPLKDAQGRGIVASIEPSKGNSQQSKKNQR